MAFERKDRCFIACYEREGKHLAGSSSIGADQPRLLQVVLEPGCGHLSDERRQLRMPMRKHISELIIIHKFEVRGSQKDVVHFV
jgi:hypothetical protein